MKKGGMGLVLGAVALVGAGVLISFHEELGSYVKKRGAQSESTAVQVMEPAPDSARALKDLLGTNKDGSLRELQQKRSEIWLTYDFVHNGRDHHTAFIKSTPIKQSGEPDDCEECIRTIAALTYRRSGGGWEVAARDMAISRFGSVGDAVPVYSVASFALGPETALAISDVRNEPEHRSEYAYVYAYRDGWTFLSGFLVGGDNAKSKSCRQSKDCYGWKGTLNALSTVSIRYPDLKLERDGTLQTVMGVLPAWDVLYRFDGNTYRSEAETAARVAEYAERNPMPQSTSGRQWYSANVNSTTCNPSQSPADRIRMIQEIGKHPKTNDLPYGVVEVIEPASAYTETVWTYYPDRAACIAALPSSQAIPSRYR